MLGALLGSPSPQEDLDALAAAGLVESKPEGFDLAPRWARRKVSSPRVSASRRAQEEGSIGGFVFMAREACEPAQTRSDLPADLFDDDFDGGPVAVEQARPYEDAEPGVERVEIELKPKAAPKAAPGEEKPKAKRKSRARDAMAHDEKAIEAAQACAVDPEHLVDFLAIRMQKGKPLTIRSWLAIEREAREACWPVAKAVQWMAEKSYASFEAEWVKGKQPPGAKKSTGRGRVAL